MDFADALKTLVAMTEADKKSAAASDTSSGPPAGQTRPSKGTGKRDPLEEILQRFFTSSDASNSGALGGMVSPNPSIATPTVPQLGNLPQSSTPSVPPYSGGVAPQPAAAPAGNQFNPPMWMRTGNTSGPSSTPAGVTGGNPIESAMGQLFGGRPATGLGVEGQTLPRQGAGLAPPGNRYMDLGSLGPPPPGAVWPNVESELKDAYNVDAGAPPQMNGPFTKNDLPLIILGALAIKAFGGNNRDISGFVQGYMGVTKEIALGKFENEKIRYQAKKEKALQDSSMKLKGLEIKLDRYKIDKETEEKYKSNLIEIVKYNKAIAYEEAQEAQRAADKVEDRQQFSSGQLATTARNVLNGPAAPVLTEEERETLGAIATKYETNPWQDISPQEKAFVNAMRAKEPLKHIKDNIDIATRTLKLNNLPFQLINDAMMSLQRYDLGTLDYQLKKWRLDNAPELLRQKSLATGLQVLRFTQGEGNTISDNQRADIAAWEKNRDQSKSAWDKAEEDAKNASKEMKMWAAKHLNGTKWDDANTAKGGELSRNHRQYNVLQNAWSEANKRVKEAKAAYESILDTAPPAVNVSGNPALGGPIGGGTPEGTAAAAKKVIQNSSSGGGFKPITGQDALNSAMERNTVTGTMKLLKDTQWSLTNPFPVELAKRFKEQVKDPAMKIEIQRLIDKHVKKTPPAKK